MAAMIIQPRRFNPRKTLIVGSVVLFAIWYNYQRPSPPPVWHITGEVWSAYSVKFTDPNLTRESFNQLAREIDALLNTVNDRMSTYKPDSEISRFNRTDSTDPVPVSAEFAEVVQRCLEICRETGGVFTPGLDRLINAWGFGHEGPRRAPDDAARETAMAHAACDAVEILPGPELRKKHPDVSLNVNALVEGWAVDQVALLLEKRGISNCFVEIGGEVFARGRSEKQRGWRVGIDRPVDSSLPGDHYDLIVELDGHGLATSGNYRKFATDDQGQKISHLLDPRTGMPATSPLSSVSVIAPDTATADALATALFVMGRIDGLAFLTGRPGIEAAFIEHGQSNSFVTTFSPGFELFLVKPGE